MTVRPLREAYDTWHESLQDSAVLHPWHRAVSRLLPPLDNLSVLEIGCGKGSFCQYLSDRFPEAKILGTDFSPTAVDLAWKAKPQSATNLRFSVQNAEQLELQDGHYDVVISCEVLEHVPKPLSMTREIHRVLKPGGLFFLTTENYFNGMILAWLTCLIHQKRFDSGSGIQPHENFFVFWKVKKLLTDANLEVTHTESNHFQWLLLPRLAPARLRTDDFKNSMLKRLFKPFGRHYTFAGHKPCQL